MSFFGRLREAWRVLRGVPDPSSGPWAGALVRLSEGDPHALIQKALDMEGGRPKAEGPRSRHIPLSPNFSEPGGRGPRKPLGYSSDLLRALAKIDPWVRAVIDIRKREVAGCSWEIVPRLRDEKREMELLHQMMQGAKRFPDRQDKLLEWQPRLLKKEMVRDLMFACLRSDVTTPETQYRFNLAYRDLVMEAEAHAHAPRRLLQHPNPDHSWADLLLAIVPDILTLDSGCLELRRRLYPLDPKLSVEGRSVPKKSNPILVVSWVDGATVRPVLDATGQLYDTDESDAPAYEQWLGSQRIDRGGWKKHELVRVVENPQTDVAWRGYGCSRVETLVRTLTLNAKVDSADFEELEREFYGGFLNLKDRQQDDLDEMRDYLTHEIEGKKHLPLISGEVEFLSATPDSSNRDKRTEARRSHYLERVCAVFEIGKTKLGNYDSANYSTSESSMEHNDEGLKGLLRVIDRAVTEQIVWAFGHKDIEYISNPASGRDEEKRLALAKQKMDLGIWDVNDARIEFGKEPIDAGESSLMYFVEFEKARGMSEGQGAAQGSSAAPEEGSEAENLDADQGGEGSPNEANVGAAPSAPFSSSAPSPSEDEEMTKGLFLDPYRAWPPIEGLD